MTLVKIEYAEGDEVVFTDPVYFQIVKEGSRWVLVVAMKNGTTKVVGEYESTDKAAKALIRVVDKVRTIMEVHKCE